MAGKFHKLQLQFQLDSYMTNAIINGQSQDCRNQAIGCRISAFVGLRATSLDLCDAVLHVLSPFVVLRLSHSSHFKGRRNESKLGIFQWEKTT